MIETATRSTPAIAPGAWREVALSDEEYAQICALLEREPTPVELGMFGAMWSEHCGYKHSRPLLRHLPTEAPWVIEGPGENAGVVDIGDGWAVVFKVESHNHPSAVEPYQGAATGVGGIVRDIFTMGARPVALLDSLRFGSLERPRNRYLFDRVVAGIGGYGNCLGIPTVGGELFFDPSFDGNPLVNAMCAGLVRHGDLTRARAGGLGNLIVLIGAETGRDGLHGATFASADDPEASHRGVVQVGNPFLEKLLLEACLELLPGGDIVAMQDLGAAGLTSSVVECAHRGGVGAEIDVAAVPRREAGMTPYEVMLSESQERMLLVIPPAAFDRVRAVVERWSLRATVIGRITDDGRVRVRDGERPVADVPSRFYADACPTYEPPAVEDPEAAARRAFDPDGLPDLDVGDDLGSILTRMLSSPNLGSRRAVYERYDHTIMTNTVVAPGVGDAALLRVKGTGRGLALALDCNPRYCWLDPRLGAMHAVAEATRNVVCVGARPLAITNCLNFGNPRKPGGYFQLKAAVSGLGAACAALGVPVVSGNVSLYNETAERSVMPTPTVGAVGVVDDLTRRATMRWRAGDLVALIGPDQTTLGGSEYLATVHGLTAGAPPLLDLDEERRVQRTVQRLIADGIVATAHDCADGGLLVALAEMALVSDVGINLDPGASPGSNRLDRALFGEGASRIVVAVAADRWPELAGRCRDEAVPVVRLGVARGTSITLPGRLDLPLEEARRAFESALQPPGPIPSAGSSGPSATAASSATTGQERT